VSNFWTSGFFNQESKTWVWTATGKEVTYAIWDTSEPQLKEGQGQTMMLTRLRDDGWPGYGYLKYKMVVQATSTIQEAYYICERPNSVVNSEY
jgi:hypothetical protein